MRSNPISMHNSIIKTISLVLFLLIGSISFAQSYSPQNLPEPHLDSIGFIIDPDNSINDEWKWSMIDVRRTYFFPRYIEPICVRVNDIEYPHDANSYVKKLAGLWELEEKTEGR